MLSTPLSRSFLEIPKFTKQLQFTLNGKRVVLESGSFDPSMSVARWLRLDSTNMKGTKLACNEGGCGSCSVIISKKDPITGEIKHKTVNSCTMLMGQLHNQAVTTIEGLGTVETGITPLQKAIVEHHGTQCGYCTPGFVMNGTQLLLENPNPTVEDIDEHFDGNLCRCTGYRGIHEAFREFTNDRSPTDRGFKDKYAKKVNEEKIVPQVPQDFFPETTVKGDILCLEKGNVQFFVPATVEQLVLLKKEYPEAELVAGATEVAIDISSKGPEKVYISTHNLPELVSLCADNEKIVFGAQTTLQDLQNYCRKCLKDTKKDMSIPQNRFYAALDERLRYFGSFQIRSTATAAGNLCHGGALTDMTNFLLACDAKITVLDVQTGQKRVETMDNFFVGYRTTKLDKKKDIVLAIEIPLTNKNSYVGVYKQAHRRDDDICFVSATVKAEIDDQNTIKDMKIAYSGMAAYPKRAQAAEKSLIGKKFELKALQDAMKLIEKDLPLAENAPGGRIEMRKLLSKSFLFRFFHQTERLRNRPHDKSACDYIPHLPPEFKPVKANMTVNGEIRQEIEMNPSVVHGHKHHISSAQQTTGEAYYIADSPDPAYTLHGYFVMSSIPHGKIKKADYSKVLAYPGVVDIVTHKDIRGVNSVGDVIKDEVILAEDEVVFRGQPIALVVAKDHETAVAAAKLAEIEYEELPHIVNIPQAVEKKSFMPLHHKICDGDLKKGFDESEHIIEGEFEVNSQQHFYLETHNAIAIPGEDDKMTIIASTQNPTLTQSELARVTGIPSHKIDVRVKRLGGGFGSKESRSIMVSNVVGVAAQKLKKPVRMQLSRQDDSSIMGFRHPFLIKYKCGFDRTGRILALETDMYVDCGWCLDLSTAITDRALFHSDSSYKIPNCRFETWMCKTNNVSHTAFRGFGAPQGVLGAECVMEHIAEFLKKPVEDVRYLNLYREGEKTHFGVPLNNCGIVPAWNFIKEKFDVKAERKRIEDFNKANKYKKRGISITPLKYGVSFTFGALNQGGALIHIYKDGTVLVQHGGIEMGQGLNTKMAQVAATALRIPLDKVFIDETTTQSVANAVPTSASATADLNGHAILKACEQINLRLDKYRTPDRTFEEAVRAAFVDKQDLTAHGYYGMPEVGYDWMKATGNPFQYYAYGASVCEVEIDTLTGDHQVIRSDLVYDAGDSLNPSIDLGQIEGAYIQGYGYLTMEEFMLGDEWHNKWIAPGKIHSTGPGHYKIPGWNDLPHQFNVSLMPKSRNPVGVYSSKAVGEPPLLLANAAAFALADAIRYARQENGVDGHLRLDFPITAERIRCLAGTKVDE